MTKAELKWRFNLDETDIEELAQLIITYLKEGFEIVHLSQNLKDTVDITATEKGFEITIPAEMYDIQKYFKQGVVIYTGKGSYAQAVNVTGGFSGKHKNYVEDAIIRAVNDWIAMKGLNAGVNVI